jgi:hypothetical protein
MTYKELKDAFMNDSPVKFRGARYPSIEVITLRKDRKAQAFIITATLADPCGRSEVTVFGKDVQPCD